MKRIISVIAVILLTSSVFAQSPEKMSYQAVIRDGSNNLVASAPVGMQISILQGTVNGPAVYVETHSANTNTNGLVSLEIGAGTVVSGSFNGIDWSSGPYFVKTETDPGGGTNYSITGTSQLLSVPYALHAKTAEAVTGGITETDPVFGASVASGITGVDTASWNNKLDAESDPQFSSSIASGIAGADTASWNNKQEQLSTGTGITISGNTISNSAPDQTVTLTGSGATTVSGTYPNFNVSSTTAAVIAGSGIAVTGSTISNTAPDQTVSLTGTGDASVTGTYPNFTVNSAPYNAGSGISVIGNTISNSAPDQTVSLNGTGDVSVTGTYPNFTVNSNPYTAGTGISVAGNIITNSAPDQTVNITGSGATSVSGTYPNFNVSSTAYSAGSGISISGSTISNSAPDQTVNLTGTGDVTVTGTYPNFTINSDPYTAGSGIAIVNNQILAANLLAMWNANALMNAPLPLTNPSNGDVLIWDSTGFGSWKHGPNNGIWEFTSPSSSNIAYENGYVGIGTDAPFSDLHVSDVAAEVRIEGCGS